MSNANELLKFGTSASFIKSDQAKPSDEKHIKSFEAGLDIALLSLKQYSEVKIKEDIDTNTIPAKAKQHMRKLVNADLSMYNHQAMFEGARSFYVLLSNKIRRMYTNRAIMVSSLESIDETININPIVVDFATQKLKAGVIRSEDGTTLNVEGLFEIEELTTKEKELLTASIIDLFDSTPSKEVITELCAKAEKQIISLIVC